MGGERDRKRGSERGEVAGAVLCCWVEKKALTHCLVLLNMHLTARSVFGVVLITIACTFVAGNDVKEIENEREESLASFVDRIGAAASAKAFDEPRGSFAVLMSLDKHIEATSKSIDVQNNLIKTAESGLNDHRRMIERAL